MLSYLEWVCHSPAIKLPYAFVLNIYITPSKVTFRIHSTWTLDGNNEQYVAVLTTIRVYFTTKLGRIRQSHIIRLTIIRSMSSIEVRLFYYLRSTNKLQ